jgi:superfamily I DNA/RNA helicase
LDKFIYSLRILISEKLNENASEEVLTSIAVDSIDLLSPLEPDKNIFAEFISFTKKFVSSLMINLEMDDSKKSIFSSLSDEDKISSLTGTLEPKILDFLHFITKSNTEKLLFEIKHINKIKGLEYEHVIVQRIEDLPYRSNENRVHGAVFFGKNYQISVDEIYDYIQELNKLYVMLTRPKKNLYIIKNQKKDCRFLDILPEDVLQ